MKVTVYGNKPIRKVIEIDDAFRVLGEDNELSSSELWDLEGDLREAIRNELGFLEISGVWAEDDTLLYES